MKDWPLALCKPTSLDPETDLEPCDLVYPDYVVENRQVYYSSRQEWIYLSNQMPNEAWVFLQSDSKASTNPSKMYAQDTMLSTDSTRSCTHRFPMSKREE